MVANTFLLDVPSIGAQAKHTIIDKSSTTERPSKGDFLLWRWEKPKSVGTLDFHSHSVLDLCECVKRLVQQPERFAFALYLPSLKAGVSREN